MSRDDARRTLTFAIMLTLTLCVVGLAGLQKAGNQWYTTWSLFFEQFARIEPVPLIVVTVSLVLAWVAIRTSSRDIDLPVREWAYRPWVIALIACATALVALCGIRWIFHGFLLADDEYSAWFQAQIFAGGRLAGRISPEWCPYAQALTPTSIVAQRGCSWHLSYFPIHSLFQAPFIALGVGRLGVPVAAGLSIWLTASTARAVWPDRPSRAYIAALALATSTQVLFMSMTMFAMATHLLASCVFLRLYVNQKKWAKLALPWTGVAALGVHSPLPHLFFVPPFIVRFARDRRWRMFAYVVAGYAVGLAFWSVYLSHSSVASAPELSAAATPGAVSARASDLGRALTLPNAAALYTMTLHYALIPAWNNPVLVVLVAAAMLSWRCLDKFSRDAALSVVLAVGARAFLPTLQGEGWGFRFIYANLGCMALLAAVGADTLVAAAGARRTRVLLATSAIVAMSVQFPLRAQGVSAVIGPYRKGYEWMTSLPNDAVVYPAPMVAWGRQLVRNDPFMRNRPKILDASQLSEDQLHVLQPDSTGRGRIRLLTRGELRSLGLPKSYRLIGPVLVEQ